MGEGRRVCLVTGAARGLGLAYARRLAEIGHAVALADVSPAVVDVAESLRDELQCACVGVVVDVTERASIAEATNTVTEALGPVGVLVNNAALFADLPLRSWDAIELDEWDRVMAVNLRGPFLCAQQVLPGMIEAGWGRIVNISSTTAMVGGVQRTHYAASKAGLIGLTRGLAREVGQHGVTVNAIAPGSTPTEAVIEAYPKDMLERFISLRSIPRFERPDDLVGMVSFLASDDAGFITGQTLVVDGGHVFL